MAGDVAQPAGLDLDDGACAAFLLSAHAARRCSLAWDCHQAMPHFSTERCRILSLRVLTVQISAVIGSRDNVMYALNPHTSTVDSLTILKAGIK